MALEKPYEEKLELYPLVNPKPTAIRYVQGDVNVYPLTLMLTSRRKPYDLADAAQITVTVRTPSGTPIVSAAELTDAAKGVLTCRVHGNMIAEAGCHTLGIAAVTAAGDRLTWQYITYEVIPQLDNGSAIAAQPTYNVLLDLIAQVQTALSGIPGGADAPSYASLSDKPRINGVELAGDLSGDDLALAPALTNQEIKAILENQI